MDTQFVYEVTKILNNIHMNMWAACWMSVNIRNVMCSVKSIFFPFLPLDAGANVWSILEFCNALISSDTGLRL